MAIQTTTFKGARYLVKFHDPIDWSESESYEAIEAVQYGAYTYISKQPVPAGVQISNTDFWLLWADPNAQMEALRQLVSQYVDDVEELSGELDTEIEARKLDIEKAHVFDTVADMKVSTNLSIGAICHTNGFHNVGDSGAAWYEISDSGTANEMDVIACGELFAKLIINNDGVTPEMFGAYGDGAHDDTEAFKKAFELARIINAKGEYNISDVVNINNDTVFNMLGTVNITCTDTEKGCFNAESKKNIVINGGTFIGAGASTSQLNIFAAIRFYDCENCKVENARFNEIRSTYVIVFESCNGCYARENVIDKYTYGGIIALNKCDNVYFNFNKLTNLINNTSPNTYPISLSAFNYPITSVVTVGKNLNAIGNYIDNSSNPWWEGIDSHGGTDITICENIVVGCYTGIAIVGSDTTEPINNVIITDNQCIMPKVGTARAVNNCGIVCDGHNLLIANNMIVNSGYIGTTNLADCGIFIPGDDETDGRIVDNLILGALHNGISVHGYNMVVENNTIEFDSKPVGATYNNIAFQINTNTHELIAKNNIVKNNDYLATGIATANGDYTYRVIFIGNDYDGDAMSYRNWIVPQTLAALPSSMGVKAGHMGDIVFNSAPSVGTPIGWICIKSADSDSDATWATLANIQ